MEIFAYGEDALTLYAIKNKLAVILQTLRDTSDSSQCQILFRPSFGRRGGEKSSQFGEFDFILLTKASIYLGESKWHRSSEPIRDGILMLRDEQQVRHAIFKFYIEEWAFGNYPTWHDFEAPAKTKLQLLGITKPVAPEGSLLASNLQTVLRIIKKRYTAMPPIQNVLLFLHSGATASQIPRGAGKDFEVVAVDYSEGIFENFIQLS